MKGREKRLLVYLVMVGTVAAWKFVPRYWAPTWVLETEHYAIASTATPGQTAEIGRVAEVLYAAYRERLGALPGFQTNHARLKLILYKDREEMRRINPGLGWAEAFYRRPNCRAYYSAKEINPYHWMLHEAVHQLNEEVAHLKLEKWLEEGLAEYFSTSRIYKGRLALGMVDINTYPVWWIDEIATERTLAQSLENKSVIPLRTIVTGRGGPTMRSSVNLYYLHWWTLMHFVFEDAKARGNAMKLLEEGGTLEGVERLVGPIGKVEGLWFEHVRELKGAEAVSSPISRTGTR